MSLDPNIPSDVVNLTLRKSHSNYVFLVSPNKHRVVEHSQCMVMNTGCI